MGKTRKFQGMRMLPFYERKKSDVRVRRDSLIKQSTERGRNCKATAALFLFFFQIKCRMAVEKLEQTTQNNRNSFSRNPQLYNLIARKYH